MTNTIKTDNAPKAIGPYSQAVESNGVIYVSGQIPLDPQTGQLVAGEIEHQTERVIENLSAILTAAGSSLSKVLKTTVFLKSMDDFPRMNETYARYFQTNPPARSTIQAAKLPRDAQLEIDAIATLD